MERVVIRSLLLVLALWSSGAVNATDRMAGKKSGGALSFDASDVTWAHAVNSREALERELTGPVDFIESDVSLGEVKGTDFGSLIPILAHPPDTTSDLSLDDFLALVTDRDAGKGLKLDFKSLAVVEPSLIVLQRHAEKLNFTLWLNADILAGPIRASAIPVKYNLFLQLCHQYFPSAVLSVGWTTEWYSTYQKEWWHYDWKDVRKMADVIRCFGYENKYPTFTFPVRGVYATRSIRQLQWLLGVIPDSSLTVWSGLMDFLELKDLMVIRESFPANKVYYDVPDPLGDLFQNRKNSTIPAEERPSSNKNQWMTFTHGPVAKCESFTYTTNDIIVFGHSMTTAVLLKKMITVDDSHGFKAQGKVRFFGGYDQQQASSVGHRLTISIVDVSLFSKNSSAESLNLSESDTDVLWTAMNASQVHTFEHNASDQCRIFKLDTEDERSFQAWTVHCDEMVEMDSLEAIATTGVAEVPLDKRLVLPEGPFMIGFISSGDGHVVIHDFEISDKKGVPETNASPTVNTAMDLFSLLFFYCVIRRLTM